MIMRALLPALFLAACAGVAPVPEAAPEAVAEGYADVDVVAIREEADDLDVDQLRERMDAIRDATWRDQAPRPPVDTGVAIELVVTSGFHAFDSSTILWREANGAWQWRRTVHDGRAPEADAFKTSSGAAAAGEAAQLDRMLASQQRRAEVWYSPPLTPMKFPQPSEACFDGASYLMAIRRAGQPDELVVQSCAARWLNGDLITQIGRLGRD